jgi:hypothetical protein
MKIKHILLSLVMCILAFEWALGDAVRPAAGERYGGGTVVRFPSPGFLFTIPESYTGFISPGEDVFVIERAQEEGYVLIITEAGMTSEKMKTLLYQFIPYEDNIFLIPTEMPQMQGNRYTLSYTAGYGEGAIKGRGLGILSDDGTVAAIFALGPSELMEHYEGILNSIADSLSFMSGE